MTYICEIYIELPYLSRLFVPNSDGGNFGLYQVFVDHIKLCGPSPIAIGFCLTVSEPSSGLIMIMSMLSGRLQVC